MFYRKSSILRKKEDEKRKTKVGVERCSRYGGVWMNAQTSTETETEEEAEDG
jgi:hypothetical protein